MKDPLPDLFRCVNFQNSLQQSCDMLGFSTKYEGEWSKNVQGEGEVRIKVAYCLSSKLNWHLCGNYLLLSFKIVWNFLST